jgi:A/G-specific adenine glycosylase
MEDAALPERIPAADTDSDRDSPTGALLDWYRRHARSLPWRAGPKARSRGARPDPYRVWLSEVMLQQTTVKAVGPYFEAFTDRWPTVEALAAAPDEDVMAAWAGLGYYSRARNLIACARKVSGELGARFPQSAADLGALPGIGAYTSAAIAAIAFDEPVAVVDGNVERVMTRYLAIADAMPAAKTIVRDRLAPLVPDDRPGEFAEAMMDLGATICTPKKPACALCPLNRNCAAHARGDPLAFPVKAPKKPKPTRYGTAFVAVRPDGAVLVRRRPPKGLLGGMVEVPGSAWADPVPAAVAPLKARWRALPDPVEHVFTHFRLFVSVRVTDVAQRTPAPDDCWWAERNRLAEIGLPSLMAKIVEAAQPGATRPAPRPAPTSEA